MRILCFSSLYPSPQAPGHGVFVQTRLRHLVADTPVRAVVLSPQAARPFQARSPDQDNCRPWSEHEHEIPVLRPCFSAWPLAGYFLNPWAIAHAAWPTVERILHQWGPIDLVDAHYFYPDAIAAGFIARRLNKPLVVTARGSDLYHFGHQRFAQRLILKTAQQASTVITVSQGLAKQAQQIGIEASKIQVLRNGVDLATFAELDRATTRSKLKHELGLSFRLDQTWLITAGRLTPLKSQDLIIRALGQLPNAVLLIAGSGPEQATLQKLVEQLQLNERVVFLGSVNQVQLNRLFAACDASVLASSREGWANVLLESMASGTPVVASRVEGTVEVVRRPEAGELVERTPSAFAQGIQTVLARQLAPAAVRAYAAEHDWRSISLAQWDIMTTAVARHGR